LKPLTKWLPSLNKKACDHELRPLNYYALSPIATIGVCCVTLLCVR